MGDAGSTPGSELKSQQHECHLGRHSSSGKGIKPCSSQVLPRLESADSETEGSMHGSSSEDGSFHGSSDASDSLRGLNRGSSFGSAASFDGPGGKPRLCFDDYELGRVATEVHPAQSDVPVFVMLPLDTVSSDGVLQNPGLLSEGFRQLKSVGVVGVMMDIWWGVAERGGPRQYDWAAYKDLVSLVKEAKLKVQAVMSFHACGGNVNDTCNIPLPPWVLAVGAHDDGIFYTDRGGFRNRECLSLWCDEDPVLAGRSPIQVYTDFMEAFKEAMGDDFGPVVVEIAVGMGPCGELRYPSYPGGDGRWRFPGVGEFQCYDRRAMIDLARAAADAGEPTWGRSGPHDAGNYNSTPQDTGFFKSQGGSWNTPYGHFFLEWYSSALVQHGERMLQAACKAFFGIDSGEWAAEAAAHGRKIKRSRFRCEARLSLKCAGVHWWYKSRSHAAELTAGYYNTRSRNGYTAVVDLCRKYGADLNFTCVEMRDVEQPAEARCGPEALLKQVRLCAAKQGVPAAGENALPRLDSTAFDAMVTNTCSTSLVIEDVDPEGNFVCSMPHSVPPMVSLTFLRWSPALLEHGNFGRFHSFVRRMQEEGQIAAARRQPRYLQSPHLHSPRYHQQSYSQSPRYSHSPRYHSSPRYSPRPGTHQPRIEPEVVTASAAAGSV